MWHLKYIICKMIMLIRSVLLIETEYILSLMHLRNTGIATFYKFYANSHCFFSSHFIDSISMIDT